MSETTYPVFVRKGVSNPSLTELISELHANRVFCTRISSFDPEGHTGIIWHHSNKESAANMMVMGGEPVPDITHSVQVW